MELAPEERILYLTPKMGLVPEVSAQTYETLARQFREVVTNSIDAGAQNVRISINTSDDRTYVLISDDGEGMSLGDLKTQFLALGGSSRYYDENKIGRIGIGFLAVAPICEYVEIYSRKKGSNEAFQAKLELKKLVDKQLRMEQIKDIAVGEIVNVTHNADEKGLEKHYTKIYLHNVTNPVLETFADRKKFIEFEKELRTILPLRYPEKCRLFEFITPRLEEMLVAEANKTKANVYLNSDKEMVRRVYGEERDENFAFVQELKGEKVGGVKVIGYFVDNQKKIRGWNGLVTRVLNVAVEDSGFLGYEGPQSVLPRVTGEIHLVGIDKNTAISISRSKFNEANDQFRQVQKYIHRKLEAFFRPAYQRTRITAEVNRRVRQLRVIPTVLTNTESTLRTLNKTKRKITAHALETSLSRAKAADPLKIEISDRYEGKIEFVDELPDPALRKKGYQIKWAGEEGVEALVSVERGVFDPQKASITLEDKRFKVSFVSAGTFNKPCDIDFEKQVVFLNNSSPLISNRDERTLFFVILATYCYARSRTKEDYHTRLLNALLASEV